MSKVSKFIKVDKDVLLEYVYNEGNLISDSYKVLVNSKDKKRSYIASDQSLTNNTNDNQLFSVDPINLKYSKINTNYFTFLQNKNYPAPTPLKHDIIKLHIPVNWTFGEHLGFYIRVYTHDSNNKEEIEFSNFYFDMTDVEQQNLLNFSTPPLLFQEKMWGKNIELQIPSISEISTQLTNNKPTENSINSNLTKGVGVSLNSPIFIDFHFISSTETINGVSKYKLSPNVTTTFPQTPDYERLGLNIENSKNGDFFEIYGTFNKTIAEFSKFIEDSYKLNKRYYVQYNITTYEQNIRGKTMTITLTDNFNEPVEFRPIIKYSTTTAIIDVEMRLIDSVDDSYILRTASYGMLQDEVSKYSLNMTKINLESVSKPKIYNIKSSINPELVGLSNSFGSITTNKGKKKIRRKSNEVKLNGDKSNERNNSEVRVEQVKVPFPVLVDRFKIIAKSESTEINSDKFYGFGKIKVVLYPFDNIINFTVASGENDKPEMVDLSRFREINMVIKNDEFSMEFPVFTESGKVDLKNGNVSFKVSQSKYSNVKKVYKSGVNVFYITGTNKSTTSVIYSGLFKTYDEKGNVDDLNDSVSKSSSIRLDKDLPRETAVIRRREVDKSYIKNKNKKRTKYKDDNDE